MHIFYCLRCKTNTNIIAALDELRVPKFMSDLKDKKANKGAKTFFNIKCRSEPPPEVKW